jgi:hypothetical protein
MKTQAYIDKAKDIVSTDRELTHGNKKINHNNIAKMWSAYLDRDISGRDVALMMVLLKVARTKAGSHNTDDYIDMVGYSSIAGELSEGETND